MNRDGFSLMELVVALTILAAGSMLCSRIFSGNMRFLEADMEISALIVETEAVLAESLLDDGIDYDTLRSGRRGPWTWTISGRLYQPFGGKEEGKKEIVPPLPRLVEVSAVVRKGRDGRRFQLTGLKKVERNNLERNAKKQ